MVKQAVAYMKGFKVLRNWKIFVKIMDYGIISTSGFVVGGVVRNSGKLLYVIKN